MLSYVYTRFIKIICDLVSSILTDSSTFVQVVRIILLYFIVTLPKNFERRSKQVDIWVIVDFKWYRF